MEGIQPITRAERVIIATVVIFIVLALIFAYTIYWPGLLENGGFPEWCDPCIDEPETPEWSLNMTGVDSSHDNNINGEGIVIGIVDTGIDITHSEFEGLELLAWKDLVNGRTKAYDDGGHGTAMASIISARGVLEGVAPAAGLIVVKAMFGNGTGSDSLVAQGIAFCADPNGDGDYSDGADIISLSLGGGEHPRFGSESGDAAIEAISNGIIVVASAGNDGTNDDGDVESPASEDLIIAVGAVDSNKTIADFSSIGDNDGRTPMPGDDRQDPNKKPELVAPGVEIVTAYPDEKYVIVSGTSPAAAFASGMIALLLQENPEFTANGTSGSVLEVKSFLMENAEKLPGQETPHDDYYGYGLIRIEA